MSEAAERHQTDERDDDKDQDIGQWITIGITMLVAIVAVIFIARNQEEVRAFVQGLGLWAPVAVVTMYVILGISPVPADALAVITGSVFEPLNGILIIIAGNVAASYVEYFIGTRMRDASNFEEMREDLPWGLADLPVESVWFQIGGRMLTSVGSKIVSYLSGIYRVNLWRFTWTTAVASSFGATVFVLGGFGLLNLF